MKIVEIDGPNDERGIKNFLGVATQVYEHDPIWVPESEQVFLQRFRAWKTSQKVRIWPIVALQDDYPVARGVSILPPESMDEYGNPQGWIGFFESLEKHQDAAESVLHRCEDILRSESVKSILAPKVDNLLVGLLANGFNLPQTILSNHNPPYYLGIFQKCGYQFISKMRTFDFTRETVQRSHIELPDFTTREFDRDELPREVAIFNRLQNSIFAGMNHYISRTPEEDNEMVQSFLPFLDDELVIIAEDKKGNAVGLLICLPDIYQAFKGQEVKRARIISIGVIPGWGNKGVGPMMSSHLMRNLLKKGYQTAEASWILANNIPPQNLAKRFNAAAGKEYVLLGKKL
jgi:ribosomal protein S18 acetylase RimI-like enzyme